MTEIGNFVVAHWETLLGVLLLLLATDGIAGYLPDKWVPYIGAVKRVAQILLTRFGKGVPVLLAFMLLSGCIGLKYNLEETAAPMAIPPPPGLSSDGARGIRVEGAVNIGTSGLRDNAGVMEVSNGGGAYAPIGTGSTLSDIAYPTGWDADTVAGATRNAIFDALALYLPLSQIGAAYDTAAEFDALFAAKQAVLAEGAFVAGDKTKLDGIEALADVTDAANVAASGAVMDGDFPTNGLMRRTGAGTYSSIPVGTLTDTYVCVYSTASGIVCNTDPSTFGGGSTDPDALDGDTVDDNLIDGAIMATPSNSKGALPTTSGVTDGYVPKKQTDGSVIWEADSTGTGGDQLRDIVATSPLLVNAGAAVNDALPGADSDVTFSMPAATNATPGHATAAHISAIEANTAKTSYTPATPGAIGGTTPAPGAFTTLSAGSGGMTVDADGDTVVKTITTAATADPGYTPYDSDAPGTDKTVGFIGWQYSDGADETENSNFLLQIIRAGSLHTFLNFDESADELYIPSAAYISGILVYGIENNISLTKGTASVDIAPGAYLNVDTSLEVNTGAVEIVGHASGGSEVVVPAGQSILAIGTMATLAGAENLTNKNLVGSGNTVPVTLVISASDRATAITATDNPKKTIRAPWAFTLTDVKASCRVAPTGANLIIDVNEATTGTSVLAAKITIEAGEYTSEDATTQPTIGDSAIANDSLLEIDFDQVGSTVAGAEVVVTLYGTRVLP